jgi:surface carbohydrate biosynthesis protein
MKKLLNNKLIIFIPVEIKTRELLSKLLLTYKLIQLADCKIIIGSQRYIFSKFSNLSNIIWIDKNTFYSKLKNYNFKNSIKFLLDEEGPFVWNYGVWNKLRFPKQIIKFYSKIILHGIKDLPFLKKYKKEGKFLIWGHPRYDLLKNYNKIFVHEKNNIIKKYNNYLLVVSSFSFDGYVDQRIENKIIELNSFERNSEENIKEHLLVKEKILKNYYHLINLTIQIAKNFPEKTIIFRPHPTQDIQKVRKRFPAALRNIRVVYEKTVTPWIMGCDYFIHSGCSTYIEAYLFRKKIINFYNCRYKNFHEFNHAGPTFFDVDLCVQFVKKTLHSNYRFLLKSKKLEKILINLNIRNNFCESFATYINKNFSKFNSSFEKNILKSSFLNKTKSKLIFILSLIKNKIILKTFLAKFLPQKYFFSKDYKLKKFNYLKKYEIMDCFKKFSYVDKNNSFIKKIKVTKICNDVYEIGKY